MKLTSKIDLFNEDCMLGMKNYPDKYFDLAVCDPPYGIGASDWDANKSMFRSNEKWKMARPSGYSIKGWDKSPPPL